MGREGRTLLVIGVMGIVSIVALTWMANRYGKVLAQRGPRPVASAEGAPAPTPNIAVLTLPTAEPAPPTVSPEDQALAYVDAFLAVRAAMRTALEAVDGAGPAGRLTVLETARKRALAAHDLDLGEYRQIRLHWRGWREEHRAATPAFEQAFRARTDRLAAADLGAMEPFD